MILSQTYEVAGFTFILEGEHPQMSNLEPFQVVDALQPDLFRLRIVKAFPPVNATPVRRRSRFSGNRHRRTS